MLDHAFMAVIFVVEYAPSIFEVVTPPWKRLEELDKVKKSNEPLTFWLVAPQLTELPYPAVYHGLIFY